MKQKKHNRHNKYNKSTKDTSKYLSWWFILLIVVFCVWALDISSKTIFDFGWWWFIFCILLGFLVGIVRLVKDKDIVWNWKEYLGGLYYSSVHSALGMMIGVFLIFGVEIVNYYIPTDNPYYNEVATVSDKRESHTKTEHSFNVEFDFENDELGNRSIRLGIGFYNQVEIGGKCIFTLQNGFFNIPVIRKIVKQ